MIERDPPIAMPHSKCEQVCVRRLAGIQDALASDHPRISEAQSQGGRCGAPYRGPTRANSERRDQVVDRERQLHRLGAGKTTLTRLLGRDYGYLTDETVGVEPGTWLIHPYEKPLSLRTADGGYPKTEHGPDSLGLQLAHPAPTLSTLMVIRRSIDHAEAPSFSQPDLLDIVPELVPETSSLVRLDRPLHLLADLAEAVGGIWLVEYAEAAHVRDWIRDRLGLP